MDCSLSLETAFTRHTLTEQVFCFVFSIIYFIYFFLSPSFKLPFRNWAHFKRLRCAGGIIEHPVFGVKVFID